MPRRWPGSWRRRRRSSRRGKPEGSPRSLIWLTRVVTVTRDHEVLAGRPKRVAEIRAYVALGFGAGAHLLAERFEEESLPPYEPRSNLAHARAPAASDGRAFWGELLRDV